jgi:hypothetical protein
MTKHQADHRSAAVPDYKQIGTTQMQMIEAPPGSQYWFGAFEFGSWNLLMLVACDLMLRLPTMPPIIMELQCNALP